MSSTVLAQRTGHSDRKDPREDQRVFIQSVWKIFFKQIKQRFSSIGFRTILKHSSDFSQTMVLLAFQVKVKCIAKSTLLKMKI